MKILKEYFELEKKIHDYFGYVEDWVTIPLDDSTDFNWYFTGSSVVYSFHELTEEFLQSGGDYYCDTLYRQRFLSQWIYRGKDYTMICVDTHTDGNKYLRIFDNAKEVTDPCDALKNYKSPWEG